MEEMLNKYGYAVAPTVVGTTLINKTSNDK